MFDKFHLQIVCARFFSFFNILIRTNRRWKMLRSISYVMIINSASHSISKYINLVKKN